MSNTSSTRRLARRLRRKRGASRLTNVDHAVILAALRFYQEAGTPRMVHFDDLSEVEEQAVDGDYVDDLCARL